MLIHRGLRLFAALISMQLLLGGGSIAATSHETLNDACKNSLQSLKDNELNDPAENLVNFRKISPLCKGSGIFELDIARFLTQLKRYREAIIELESVKGTGTAYEHLIRYSISQNLIRQGHIDAAQENAKSLTELFPEWGGGYSELGFISGLKRDYPKAIEYAEKSNQLLGDNDPPIKFINLTGLTVSYYNMNRFRESAQAMQAALRLNNAAIRDESSVLAASASLVEIGRVELADNLIARHLAEMPESRDHPQFIRLLQLMNDYRSSKKSP